MRLSLDDIRPEYIKMMGTLKRITPHCQCDDIVEYEEIHAGETDHSIFPKRPSYWLGFKRLCETCKNQWGSVVYLPENPITIKETRCETKL